jgi:hypothetical protein
MSTMISGVYGALREAGASEEKARKAAEARASYENRFAKIDERFAIMDGRLVLLQGMLGFNLRDDGRDPVESLSCIK